MQAELSKGMRALSLAVAMALSAPAMSQSGSDAVAEARVLQQAGKASEAYALLSPLAGQRAGEPAFDYAYATAALDSGHPGEAILALQRVLAVQPNNSVARAELARAYAAAGDVDTAKATFQTVVGDPTIPDPVRRRFDNLIGQYDRQIKGGGSNVNGYVEFELGHDSNINSATALSQITIPLFAWLGAGQLSGSSRAMDDTTLNLQGGVTGVHAIDRQNRVFGSVLGSWRDNRHSRQFDQQAFTLTGGYAHTFASRDVLSVSGQFNNFWMGGDSLRRSTAGIVQYTHFTTAGNALSVAGQYAHLDFQNNVMPDARRYGANVSYSTQRWLVGGQVGRESTLNRAMRASAFGYVGLNAGFQVPLWQKALYYADASWERRDHEGMDVLFLRKRQDNRYDIGTGVKWLLAPRLQLLTRGSWSRNHSNIALYDYSRWTANIGLRYEF